MFVNISVYRLCREIINIFPWICKHLFGHHVSINPFSSTFFFQFFEQIRPLFVSLFIEQTWSHHSMNVVIIQFTIEMKTTKEDKSGHHFGSAFLYTVCKL